MNFHWNKKYPITKIEKKDFHKNALLKRLLEIPDCPEQIFWRGNMPTNSILEKTKFLTVVGSRAISSYGKDAIKTLFEGLKGENICIISGMAIGADSEAHIAALNSNLWTIVVPGSGINEDVIYPRTNTKLANHILENNGVLLNEFEPDFVSTLWSFPRRNRIKAAISDAVFIIEAGEKSGTLITARLAVEYNKDVLCLPGSIFSRNSKGTNRLISEGAKIVLDANDILEALNLPRRNQPKTNSQIRKEVEGLTDHEKILWDNLEEEKTRDELQTISKLSVTDFLMALTMLEMKNLTQENAGLVRRKV
jgi:DNA processing protein